MTGSVFNFRVDPFVINSLAMEKLLPRHTFYWCLLQVDCKPLLPLDKGMICSKGIPHKYRTHWALQWSATSAFPLYFLFWPADYTCTHVYSQTTWNPQTFLEADCFLLLRNPHTFLAAHSAFMWLSHTVAQWNLLKELPTHQIFHELGPDTSMRGKTMSETRPALAFCPVCVTVILPAALLHSTSYFSDHQKAPWMPSVIAGLELPACFPSLWHPVAPDWT